MNSMMKFNILLFAMAVPAFCVPALGADDNAAVCPVTGAAGAPSTQPAMPPGHGAMPAAKPDASGADNNAGVCPVTGATGMTSTQPAMPPGHGAMPATGAGGAGTISIEAVQGTKGGPQIGQDEVIVQLIPPDDENNAMPEIKTIKTKLDKQGKVDLKNLSLQSPVQPRVMVNHAGVWFDALGKLMDADNPSQKITVSVFETTQEMPNWDLQKRILRMRPVPEGLEVMEMLELHNPSDRAWLGNADTQGKRSWVVLSLPAAASNVGLPPGVSVADGQLISTMPLHPGDTQVVINYKLPVKDGNATLDLSAPVPVQGLMVLLPDDKSTLQGQGVHFARTLNMGEPVRAFEAPPMQAGQRLVLTVANLGKEPEAPAASSSDLPQTLAVVGGGVIVVLCVVMMVFRPGKKAKAADQPVKSKPAKG